MARFPRFGRASGIQLRGMSNRRFLRRLKMLTSKRSMTVDTSIATSHYKCTVGCGLQLRFSRVKPSGVSSPRATYRVVASGSSLKWKLVKTSSLSMTGKRDGYRLFDLSRLGAHFVSVIRHCMGCAPCHGIVEAGGLPVAFLGEVARMGLASCMRVKCLGLV